MEETGNFTFPSSVSVPLISKRDPQLRIGQLRPGIEKEALQFKFGSGQQLARRKGTGQPQTGIVLLDSRPGRSAWNGRQTTGRNRA